jgi:uncharacterized membrane protein
MRTLCRLVLMTFLLVFLFLISCFLTLFIEIGFLLIKKKKEVDYVLWESVPVRWL